MSDSGALELFIKAGNDIVDGMLSKADGGSKLDRGVKELVSTDFPGVEIIPSHEASGGFNALKAELEAGTSSLLGAEPDVVMLSIVDEVNSLPDRAGDPNAAVEIVREELVALIGLIKEKVGAHVLIASASTVDPAEKPFNYSKYDVDPLSLRAHRLSSMLVGVSHDEGISIVDVDRIIAELGADEHVESVFSYSTRACEAIAAEVVRILEDYGFFDERPLVAQVGAKSR